MLCQMCKSKEASIIKKIDLGSGVIETYICDDCALRMSSKNVFNEKYREDFWGSAEQEIRCEKCKTTLSDFEETLYVGCENCYKAFASEIAKKAQEIHGKNVYVGKVPAKLVSKISRANELEQLKSKLALAERDGNIVEAKKLRAKIFSIGGDSRV